MLKAARFHVILFFYAYQCEDTREYGSIQGSMLDALFQLQHSAQSCGVEKFILITDSRVFGSEQTGLEEETPIPETPTGVLINAAEEVLRCIESNTMKTLLIRVSHLYAAGADDAFFQRVRQCADNEQTFLLDAARDDLCDFLHADDLAYFVILSLERRLTGVVHLAYGEKLTYGDVCDKLQEKLPELKISFTNKALVRPALQCDTAYKATGWVPRHQWENELDEILQSTAAGKAGHTFRDRAKRFRQRLFGKVLPWVELILFALIAEFLLRAVETNATFRFIDYWLLYVILMGTMHGGPVGVMAGIIACIGYSFNWFEQGKDVYLLLYNTDNWLPLVMYLLGGSVFGYMHDKNTEKLASVQHEIKQRNADTEFMQSMYMQVDADRNLLQEQVVRYRDSYGRIYAITQELDTLQPEQVFLSTLDILEDIMQNHSVALYSCNDKSAFARLVVHSRAMSNLPKSMDLNEFPLLTKAFKKGEVFANTKLEPGYPVFCAPVMQNKSTIAIIALWDVPFEQQTLYLQNLFSVVAGLVQASMVRALHYLDLSKDMYIPNTHILTDQAFHSTMSVYSQMRKKRSAIYLLLSVQSEDNITSVEEYDRRIGRATRSTDIAGMLNNGQIYVLLPQATLENLPQIEKRFKAAGLRCAVTSQEIRNERS